MRPPWFRMYAEFAGDVVVQTLPFADQRHYIVLLCLKAAGLLDHKFASTETRERNILEALRIDERAAQETRARLAEQGLVDASTWQPLGWAKRQFRDDVAERVRRHRARKAERAAVVVSEEEQESEKNRSDQIRSDGNKRRNVTRNVTESSANPKKKGKSWTRVSSDWLPSNATVTALKGECNGACNVDLELELRKFKDHEFAKPHYDEDATFRNWVREAISRAQHVSPHARDGPVATTKLERNLARLDRYDEELKRTAQLTLGKDDDDTH
jgi:hypothetical protein